MCRQAVSFPSGVCLNCQKTPKSIVCPKGHKSARNDLKIKSIIEVRAVDVILVCHNLCARPRYFYDARYWERPAPVRDYLIYCLREVRFKRPELRLELSNYTSGKNTRKNVLRFFQRELDKKLRFVCNIRCNMNSLRINL